MKKRRVLVDSIIVMWRYCQINQTHAIEFMGERALGYLCKWWQTKHMSHWHFHFIICFGLSFGLINQNQYSHPCGHWALSQETARKWEKKGWRACNRVTAHIPPWPRKKILSRQMAIHTRPVDAEAFNPPPSPTTTTWYVVVIAASLFIQSPQ